MESQELFIRARTLGDRYNPPIVNYKVFIGAVISLLIIDMSSRLPYVNNQSYISSSECCNKRIPYINNLYRWYELDKKVKREKKKSFVIAFQEISWEPTSGPWNKMNLIAEN